METRTDNLGELMGRREAAAARLKAKADEAIAAQREVPELAKATAEAAYNLFSKFRQISQLRGEALECARFVNRLDADIKVTLGRRGGDGNTYGALDVIAAHHGEAKVKDLLLEVGGHFDYLAGVDGNNTTQDVSRFVLEKALKGYRTRGGAS